ncbi:short-chain dehydrogenase [Virgisporangium aliadipatigenens]|uniref:Short-chain dehydrogenase n=1 Tax=Virgisporangium aliadipatigenens TaxID=741659 RepID=A0A8J4DNE6_9ACTN|nr:SDR family NAD(P)-dependent oxidoreductase [Virgisporangium aliadipatigenens]GIJ43498.1 short-chain dehydrogenase [Virgisporangium aliadipatigenens]
MVVVTGASTGLGAATARELAGRGFHVLAGVRRESDADAIRANGVEPVMLDITSSEQIAALAARVEAGPALRALVNNAGIAVNAPVEALPIDDWRWQFEVNLFGQVAVTQALLPALLRNAGRVVNISSIGGRVALPTYGAYAGAKFALEAVSDALRREMKPHGLQVVVVEPGGVVTRLNGRAVATVRQLADRMTAAQHRRHDGLIEAIISHSAAFTKAGTPADRAAQVVAKAVTARKPRTRYTIGRDAALMTRVPRFVSDRVLDRMLAADLRPHFPKG